MSDNATLEAEDRLNLCTLHSIRSTSFAGAVVMLAVSHFQTSFMTLFRHFNQPISEIERLISDLMVMVLLPDYGWFLENPPLNFIDNRSPTNSSFSSHLECTFTYSYLLHTVIVHLSCCRHNLWRNRRSFYVVYRLDVPVWRCCGSDSMV